MKIDLMQLLQVATDLREALGRLDGMGLVAAGAFIDHALSVVDYEIVEAKRASPRVMLAPEAFAMLDQMAELLFSDGEQLPVHEPLA